MVYERARSAAVAPSPGAAVACRDAAGANPASGPLAAVERQMRSAFFSLFSVPSEQGDTPIYATLPFPFSLLQRLPFVSQLLLAAVDVHEAPLRFQTSLEAAACQLLATNQVGEHIATVDIRWTPIPWDYPANPYTNPPQTILNPFASQRFEMLNGEFRFNDAQNSGVHGFGCGRTFPLFPAGLSLDIGAVIDVLEGYGALRGHRGLMVVNGVITPPQELDLNIMMRILDPGGGLLTDGPLTPLVPQSFPTTAGTFMMLMGEPDPARPSTLRLGPGGEVVGLELHERLRAVALDFDVLPAAGPRSQVLVGKVVGRGRSTLHLPLGGGAGAAGCSGSGSPIPVQTSDGEFELFDEQLGLCFGSVEADLVEGRGFPTAVPDAAGPLYRIGGFGPIRGGTGEFAGASGILSLNSVLSLSPRTFSNLYVFRFHDPQGKYRPVLGSLGS